MNTSSQKFLNSKIPRQKLNLLDLPKTLPIWEWAERERRLDRNVTAKPGRYRTEIAPYQKEPQEALTDLEVQVTVLYWAKRLGKTEIANNLIGSTVCQNPRNILVAYPTLDSATKWSKQMLTPMIRSTPALHGKFKDSGTRDANNTLLAKNFPGGTVTMIGANSPSGFRQIQAPIVFCDEIDSMENGPEGDPVTLAFGRAENYHDSIQLLASTATIEETSRIEAWWQSSDKRLWFCKCPACGKSHVLTWANVKWPSPHKHAEAWYECPDCHAHWNDDMRLEAIRAGEWRASAPFTGIRGYWLNGLNSVFSAKKGYKTKLHQFAAEFYDAFKKGESSRISWQNTFLCEPHKEAGEKIDKASLLDRCENYDGQSLPDNMLVVGAAVDVQGNRLEYEIIGAGADRETWGIEYGKIIGDPERDEVWESLKQKLSTTFKRKDGVILDIVCCTIDHRHKGSRVRNFIRTCGRGRVWPVYGYSGTQSLLVVPHQNKHYRMILFSVNTDAGKDELFARLRVKDMGPGYLHFPKGCGYENTPQGFFDQLTAEERRIRYKNGFPESFYWKDVNKRNEAIDLRVYFLAAMDILKPSWEAIAKALDARREKSAEPSQQKTYDIKPGETMQLARPPIQKPKAPRWAVGPGGSGPRRKWM
jgi:phage terminase large subunit GpA-like protein